MSYLSLGCGLLALTLRRAGSPRQASSQSRTRRSSDTLRNTNYTLNGLYIATLLVFIYSTCILPLLGKGFAQLFCPQLRPSTSF